MPLRQTTAAARRRGMLGDEHRMSLERRLLAVVPWDCRPHALGQEVGAFNENDLQTFVVEVP